MMAANDDRTNSEARTREFTDQNLGVFKTMLEGLEKQIAEETESRRQNEEETKHWLNQKLDVMARSQRGDEQAALDREKNLMTQV